MTDTTESENTLLSQLDAYNVKMESLFDEVEKYRMFDAEDDGLFKFSDLEKIQYTEAERECRYKDIIDYLLIVNGFQYPGGNIPIDRKSHVQTLAMHRHTQEGLKKLRDIYTPIYHDITSGRNPAPEDITNRLAVDRIRIDEALVGIDTLIRAIEHKNKIDNLLCLCANKMGFNVDKLSEEVQEEVKEEVKEEVHEEVSPQAEAIEAI